MTKQQKTYVLLTAVAIVWGLIGYRIYIGMNPTTEIVEAGIQQQKFTPKTFEKTKAYTLKADYRDPFLGKLATQKKNVRKKTAPTSKKNDIPFPNIIYNGIVEGGRSKSYTVTVNGKQELLKIGQSIQEVKLLKANTDQITLLFNGITKVIKLQ